MNNEKAYEKLLASQLEKLEAPDSADKHWPAMKALLDRDLPEGGAGFRWGYLLLFLLLCSVAGWYFWPSAPVHTAKSLPATVAPVASVSTNVPDAKTASAINTPATVIAPVTATPAAKESLPVSGTPEAKHTTTRDINTGNETAEVRVKSAVEKINRKNSKVVTTARNKESSRAALIFPGRKIFSTVKPLNQSGEILMETEAFEAVAVVPVGMDRSVSLLLNGIGGMDSMDARHGEQLMRFRPFRSRFPEETDRTRSLRNRTVGTGDNKNFVFGLTLPLTVAISDQKTSAFNSSGGANKLQDYLPSPHVQYHINDKSFLQTELQFYAPQYIRPALLYQQTQANAGGSGNNLYRTRSVYTEKLYYFNVPVSGYYSPFKNFYLGTGMQFSRLLSGIAHVQETTGPAYNPASNTFVVNDYFSRFRSDSLSASLNNNEFRVLLDANYYWKKFTMGFRYNQALGNYISLQVNGFSPYYTDRNKSFLFYLRYNLWENYKSPKAAMAFKPQ